MFLNKNIQSLLIVVLVLVSPLIASAYTPGETLNPACGPTDTGCDVVIGSLTGSYTASETGLHLDVGSGQMSIALDGSTLSQSASGLKVNAVGSSQITDGTIVNADISLSAAIAYSKLNLSSSLVNADVSSSAAIDWSKISKVGATLLDIGMPTYTGNAGKMLVVNGGETGVSWVSALSSSLASGKIFVGNASGTAAAVSISSDATISNTGVLTIGSDAVALGTDTTGNYVKSIANTSGTGISGGNVGSEGATLTLSLDINGLTAESAINDADALAIYDDSAGVIRKISRANFLTGITGALIYQGTWNATTNSPSLSDASGTQGHYYVVSTAGTQPGVASGATFNVGDWVVRNSTTWQKLSNTDSVASVFGRTGAITSGTGDYDAIQIDNTATGTISATNVQAALNELDEEKFGVGTKITDLDVPSYTGNAGKMLVVNASSTSVVWASALTTALASGSIFVGNGSGVATAAAISGDATLSNTGALNIVADAVALGTDTTGNYVAGVTSNGGLALTGTEGGTLGITLNGTTLSLGASGLSLNLANANTWSETQTFSNAIVAPTSADTINGLIVNSGALTGVTGVALTSGNFSQGGTGTFGTASGDVSLNGDTILATGKTLTLSDMTQGSVLIGGASGVVSQDNAGLFFNATSNRLGIGTAAPTNALTFAAASTIDSLGALSMTTASNGNLSLTSHGTGSVTLDSGTTGSINIGTGVNAKTIYLGSTGAAGTIVINSPSSGSAGTVLLPSVTAASSYISSNVFTSPVTTGDVGLHTDIAIGSDGLPVISYYSNTNKQLEVLHCTTEDCSTYDTPVVVDTTTSVDVGQYTSIAIGTDGYPIISYMDVTNTALYSVHCTNESCSTHDSPVLLDTNATNFNTEIAIGSDDYPIISYNLATDNKLYVKHCTDVGCSTSDARRLIDDTAIISGRDNFIIIGVDGLPFLAYRDTTNGALKMAHCDTVNCSSVTRSAIGSIDANNISVAIVNRLPVISMVNMSTSNLVTYACSDIACTAGTATTVDSSYSYTRTAIATASDGLPIILGSTSNGGIRYHKCANNTCSSKTSTQISTNNGDSWPSLAIGSDGLPVASMYKTDTSDLRTWHATDNSGTGVANQVYTGLGVDIGSINKFFRNIYTANVYAKQTQVSFFDVAEEYPTEDEDLEAGDVVSIDIANAGYVKKAEVGESAIGVVSTKPGLLLGDWEQDDDVTKVPLALVGRVPVKIEGSVLTGDYLTLSTTTSGIARKAVSGEATIGKALEDAEDGTVMMFIYNSGASAQIGSTTTEDGVTITTLNNLLISGALTVDGHIAMGPDTVGEATISANTTSTTISFETPYTDKPAITVTPEAQVDGTYWVSGISADGFDINVSTSQGSAVTFSWHAFGQSGVAFSSIDAVTTEREEDEAGATMGDEVEEGDDVIVGDEEGGDVTLSCIAPQVLNSAGDACEDPAENQEVALLECTLPEVLNTAGDTCEVPPVVTDEPIIAQELPVVEEVVVETETEVVVGGDAE
jgi:hypothetical protein